MSEALSFRWLPEECCQDVEDPYRVWGLCNVLEADARVEENTIKIVKNDPFVESLHDLHMISF